MLDQNKSLVYICIPCYNAAATIPETLTSIVNQTYQNIKIIILDNASIDNTINIASQFAERDNRIVIHAFKQNVGGEGNFTRCIETGGGSYTAIFHADDVYSEKMVEEQVKFLDEYKDVGAVFTEALLINGVSRVVGKLNREPKNTTGKKYLIFNYSELFSNILSNGNFLIFPSAMVRTEIYQNEIKAWNKRDFGTSADLDVWLRIAENHQIGVICKPLMKYRVSEASYTYRMHTQRTFSEPMISVLDYFIHEKKWGNSEKDQNSYKRQYLKDWLIRARNYLINGDKPNARKLIYESFKYVNIKAIGDRKQLYLILLIPLIWCASWLSFGSKVIILILRIKMLFRAY